MDDASGEDPRALRAGVPAFGLHVRGLLYCARHLTDGVLPHEFVSLIPDGEALSDRLVQVGMWEKRENGFFIPDYLRWNMSAAELRKRRDADARRKKLGFQLDSPRNPSGVPTTGNPNGIQSPSPSPLTTPVQESARNPRRLLEMQRRIKNGENPDAVAGEIVDQIQRERDGNGDSPVSAPEAIDGNR